MGSGIKRMKKLMRDAGLQEPEFTSDAFFHAIFYRNPEYSLKLTGKKTTQETTQQTAQETTQEKIFILLKAHPAITRKELAAKIGISNDGVKYHLNMLKLSGRVRHVALLKRDIGR